jgi:hypothetical protein
MENNKREEKKGATLSPGVSSAWAAFCCFCLSGNKGWDGLKAEVPFPLNGKRIGEKNHKFIKLHSSSKAKAHETIETNVNSYQGVNHLQLLWGNQLL